MDNIWPDNIATDTWDVDDMRFYLVHTNGGHYCGYVRFTERFMQEERYSGILTYVPVHGGITLAEEDDNGMIYGFDCAHLNDDHNPNTWSIPWLKAECEKMGLAIKVAKEFEADYLSSDDNEHRAKILDSYREKLVSMGIEYNLENNFGFMISMLGGQL
jgi:hypothetical protein